MYPSRITPHPLHQVRFTSRKFDIIYFSGLEFVLYILHNRTFVMLIPMLTFYFNFKVGPWGGRSLNLLRHPAPQLVSTPPGGGGLTPPLAPREA